MTPKEWLNNQQDFLQEIQFYANLRSEILILPEELNLCNLIQDRARDFLQAKKLPLPKPSNVTNVAKSSPGSSKHQSPPNTAAENAAEHTPNQTKAPE